MALIAWGSGMFALASTVALPRSSPCSGLTPIAVRLPFLILRRDEHPDAGLAGEGDSRIGRPAHRGTAAGHLAGNISRSLGRCEPVAAGAIGGRVDRRTSTGPPLVVALVVRVFGLSSYAYGTAYIAVPLILAMVVPYALFTLPHVRRAAERCLLVGGMVASPALLYALVNLFKWDPIVTPWFRAWGCRDQAVTKRWGTLT